MSDSGISVLHATDWHDVYEPKVDLACGQNKKDGFFGVDIAPTEDADLVWDLGRAPWPFATDSVEEAYCAHYVEHTYPVGGPNDGLISFMNELHRVCAPDAKVEIIHPYAQGKRAFQDPTHTRYINEVTWWYFNRDWMRAQKLDHYPITANFEIVNIGHGWYPGWELRSQPTQEFGAEHYWDVVTDLFVTLRAVKE